MDKNSPSCFLYCVDGKLAAPGRVPADPLGDFHFRAGVMNVLPSFLTVSWQRRERPGEEQAGAQANRVL